MFNYAYNFFTQLLQDYTAKRDPGDVAEYEEDFVNAYIDVYNSMYEPFEVQEYDSIDTAKSVFMDALSKKQYGNALAIS